MSEDKFYGEDCPSGMVQIAFVGCSPDNRIGDYKWKPQKSAFIEVYVDGKRFRIDVGDFHDGNVQRRGLHIVTSKRHQIEKTAVNSCSVWIDSEDA